MVTAFLGGLVTEVRRTEELLYIAATLGTDAALGPARAFAGGIDWRWHRENARYRAAYREAQRRGDSQVAGDLKAAVAAIREARNVLELIGRVTGEFAPPGLRITTEGSVEYVLRRQTPEEARAAELHAGSVEDMEGQFIEGETVAPPKGATQQRSSGDA